MSKKEIEEWRTTLLYCSLNCSLMTDGGGENPEFWFYDLWNVELQAAWYGYRLT